jgi:ATP-binding cassette subfamily B protein
MSSNTENVGSHRASGAPPLPSRVVPFILFCLVQFRGWLLLMLVFETGQAAGSILVPYAIKAVMDGVAQSAYRHETLEALRDPPSVAGGT